MEAKRPSFFSADEMKRTFAIREVLKDYKDELAYQKEHPEELIEETVHIDPSAVFISARQYRDFHEWCPVKYLHPTLPIL